MKGLVIGGVGIVHVFLAQFAIGGGMLLCYFEWLSQRRGNEDAGKFVESYFKFLVLLSFVAGAVTGVAMWLVSIQVSARTIGLMVERFHWIWALEWTFFALEVVAGYTFYKLGPGLDGKTRLRLLILYSVASWFSLFWINGILSWQLTPGSGSFWGAFFNPSFFPSLAYRTLAAMSIAALVACVAISRMVELDLERQRKLVAQAANFLKPMILMPLLGGWFLLVIPEDSRGWLLGGSPAMTMFVGLATGASLLLGAYAVLGPWRLKLHISGATALLLCAIAFGATAAGEFVREGARKPYTVRGALYANSITPDEVAELRVLGVEAIDPYPLVDRERYPTDQLALGAKAYRFQCTVCHTMNGANGLTHLAGGWSREQLRLNIAKLQQTKPFMPPFAGPAAEVEAISELIRWEAAGAPATWESSNDSQAIERIARYLNEAGVR